MAINSVTGLFKITQYNNKIVISIASLVETIWLSRYLIPMEITYLQWSEFIGNEFSKYLIEREYGISAKKITSGNTNSNDILERIQQVLGNLVRTFNIQQKYVDKNDPWTGILDAAAFEIRSTTSGQKGYSPVQLIFSVIWFSW